MTRTRTTLEAETNVAITSRPPSCITRNDLRRVAEKRAADLLAAAERSGQNRTGWQQRALQIARCAFFLGVVW